MPSDSKPAHGHSAWQSDRPRQRLFGLLASWLAMGVALMVVAGLLPGVGIESIWGALLVAAVVAALNAVIPPVLAALRLPLTLVLGFLLVLVADAAILLIAAELTDGVLTVDNFGWALLAALAVAAVSVVLAVFTGSDDTYSIRVAKRIARRQGVETDLSSQTGASQTGILLGSNEDIPAFRWVEKETATVMSCSAPPDCAEIERRHATGIGLLVDGGSSRGNLLSGEAEDVILTVKQRNGYGLDELVERSLAKGDVSGIAGGDEQSSMVGNAFSEATGKKAKKAKNDISDRDVVVLGSGNLGLVYLMEERRRLTLEELDARHPELVPALRAHPHVGWLLVRSSEHGPVALGARGAHYLVDGRVEGEDPLAPFSATAPQHLLRTDGFTHVADIMVGSFYDPELDEGCAFEELICFHGGIGGVQTRPFILHPAHLELPPGPILGAASVHAILAGWRKTLRDGPPAAVPAPAERTAATPVS